MNDNTKSDNEIRLFLDLPSSELGVYLSDTSEDVDDVDVDPLYQISGTESETDSYIDRDEMLLQEVDDLETNAEHDVPGPSNVSSKRPKTRPTTNENTKKRKINRKKVFRPKQKYKNVPKNNNVRTQKTKYPHEWTSTDFTPEVFDFDDSESGVVHYDTFPEDVSELFCFEKIMTDEIVDLVVSETNKQFEYIASSTTLADKSRLKQWVPVTNKEMKLFLATTLLMVHSKKIALDDYWSSDCLQKNSVSKYMSRDRYLIILRLLHFSDNTQPPVHGKLNKIKNVIDMFRAQFSSSFKPFRNLCIDESLLLFKGQLGFKMFIPSKRSRFGIKLYILCDCETGYILDAIVYTGNDTDYLDTENIGISGAIVTTLLKPYINKGHCLYVDNWYTSPDLFTFLHKNKTNACGTVKFTRMGMPQFEQDLEVGEREGKNDGTCLAVRWIDKREVLMLTSEHEDQMVSTGKLDRKSKLPITKPKCVHEYNQHMGAVDRSDMMIVNVECVRRTTRWYKKLFFHFVDLSMLNAHAIYLCQTGKKPTLKQFHLEVVRQLLQSNMEPRLKPRGGRPSSGDIPMRLTQRHFPSLVPPTEKRKTAQRVCFVCKNTKQREQKRRDSRYQCAECDVGLCVVPCFAQYHELKNF